MLECPVEREVSLVPRPFNTAGGGSGNETNVRCDVSSPLSVCLPTLFLHTSLSCLVSWYNIALPDQEEVLVPSLLALPV